MFWKISYNEHMKLYQTVDGTMIGFYQESGAAVQCTSYRDLYETQLVTKEKQEEVVVAGYYEQVQKTEPGHWKTERQYVQGHYEIKPYWFEEYSVQRYRTIPAHYEILPYWFEEYSVTRYRTVPGYWQAYEREIPPRGVYEESGPPYTWYRWIEEHIEEYEEVIPAGYKDTRVWVEEKVEPYEEIMPAGYKDTRVWVDGVYDDVEVWVPQRTTTEAVWHETVITMKTVEYQELDEVWVGREPIYEFVDPSQVTTFEVVALIPAEYGKIELEDSIVIRNTLTGEELTTTARYLGLAERIDENEYVVP